ncbi:GNAT family N-acetyltransferase [Bacillus sp. 2205SS5-2]|uniref:GNAT family N-acetyltransferase n=1 Tax=Bacillus sp. 2205SS5-2 TaxID=3109031 RepID=UPI003004FFE3
MEIRKLDVHENPPMDLLLTADPSRMKVKEYLDRGDCYVMVCRNEIIGVYMLLATGPETIELVNVAVSENKQGKGIGKQLILHAIQKSTEVGFNKIEIGTGNSSIGQLALYQKCGFRITGVEANYFVNHYEEKIFENGIWCRDRVQLSLELK